MFSITHSLLLGFFFHPLKNVKTIVRCRLYKNRWWPNLAHRALPVESWSADLSPRVSLI